MDATTYLTRQGWRGAGHALHPSGHGIKQPLLVSKKTNSLGVGKKAHDAHADQWWSRAFDATLKSINGQDVAKEVIQTSEGNVTLVGSYSAKWTREGGLYGNFVRGEGLKGTIGAKQDMKKSGTGVERPRKKRRLNNPVESKEGWDEISQARAYDQRIQELPSLYSTGMPDASLSAGRVVKQPASHNQDAAEVTVAHQRATKKKIRTIDNDDAPNARSVRKKSNLEKPTAESDCSVSRKAAAGAAETPRQDHDPGELRAKESKRRLKNGKLEAKVVMNLEGSEVGSDQRARRRKKKRKGKEEISFCTGNN
ncbi:MAG: hypothetical protein Q9181_001960 [Wetmoreana brouardii]